MLTLMKTNKTKLTLAALGALALGCTSPGWAQTGAGTGTTGNAGGTTYDGSAGTTQDNRDASRDTSTWQSGSGDADRRSTSRDGIGTARPADRPTDRPGMGGTAERPGMSGTANRSGMDDSAGIPRASAVQQALRSDASVSNWAGNVSVTTENQRVVLRGTVPSQEAKTLIEQRARDAAGGATIDSQLTVSDRNNPPMNNDPRTFPDSSGRTGPSPDTSGSTTR
jgi:hypothetical protein